MRWLQTEHLTGGGLSAQIYSVTMQLLYAYIILFSAKFICIDQWTLMFTSDALSNDAYIHAFIPWNPLPEPLPNLVGHHHH